MSNNTTPSDVFMVMSSNTVVGGNPIYLVVGDATAGMGSTPSTITRYAGAIISNGENNILKWYISNKTGAFTIPWGYDNTSGGYIPFTFNITTAGTDQHYINFSTYRTGALNSAMMPSGMTNCWSSSCNCDASYYMVDRFWMIDNADYGVYGNRPRGDLTLYYVDGGGTNPEVTTTGNIFTETNLEAEGYNNNSNLWVGNTYGDDVDASNYVWNTGEIPANFLYKWWTLVDKNKPLPVTWLNLSAECNDKDMLVKWNTASEQNADHFTVERSVDGVQFVQVGSVPASGNSSTMKSYSYTDPDVPNTTLYYRIKETDNNGASMTSGQVIQSGCTGDVSISVFPNPSTGPGSINVALSGSSDEEVLIVITDMLGREFYSKVIFLSGEQQIVAIDPAHQLAAGVYSVIASSNDKVVNSKIVIQ